MAKKAKKKLPKTIAGVKVPKELREAGAKAAVLLDHPMVIDLVAAALLAAAAAIREGDRIQAAAGAAGEEAADAADEVRRSAGTAKRAAKAAAAAIGRGILDELQEAFGDGNGKRGGRGGKGGGTGD